MHRHYARGERYCGLCCEWIYPARERCPRCGRPLRSRPRKFGRGAAQAARPAAATE